MTSTQTIEAIHLHLDNTPTDWQARRELADLLEDEGRMDEARYQRWAAQWEKAPVLNPGVFIGWHWWRSPDSSRGNSHIGWLVFKINKYVSGFDTRKEAERELMRVLIAYGWPDYQPLRIKEQQ